MIQDYYLLLGISRDIVKPEIIRVAAETRMRELKDAFERLQLCIERTETGDPYDYAMLEVSPHASIAEIKESTQRKIAAIKEAYQTLINPAKRAAYDQTLAADSSFTNTPMILKQSAEKHSSCKKNSSPPIPIPISSLPPSEKRRSSSLIWLGAFVIIAVLAIAVFLGLRLIV